MTWHDYATVVCVFLTGLFSGAQTIRADAPNQSIFPKMFADSPKLMAWWIGGNDKYNPSNPFQCDFWHLQKFLWIYAFCAAISFQIWARYGVWWAIGSFLVLQALHGTSFRWYYGYGMRLGNRGYWQFFKSCNPFDLFTNHH